MEVVWGVPMHAVLTVGDARRLDFGGRDWLSKFQKERQKTSLESTRLESSIEAHSVGVQNTTSTVQKSKKETRGNELGETEIYMSPSETRVLCLRVVGVQGEMILGKQQHVDTVEREHTASEGERDEDRAATHAREPQKGSDFPTREEDCDALRRERLCMRNRNLPRRDVYIQTQVPRAQGRVGGVQVA